MFFLSDHFESSAENKLKKITVKAKNKNVKKTVDI